MTPDASRGVVIDGAGLGHGVGLCQTGAARLAAAGETARAILHHYFPRATPVVRADGSIGNLEASSE
jgi:SpoIID/LytB domain protein